MISHPINLLDITGQKFGMLTVVSYSGLSSGTKRSRSTWMCICDCGNSIIAKSENLIRGYRKTCGCSTQKLKHKKHGMAKSPTYLVWVLMIRRCHSPASEQERVLYADRGIRVCESWRESFGNFLKDMGVRPIGCQIDRIDNNLGYFKENCRWATSKEQGRNKRTNRLIEFNGDKKCLSEWAEQLNIPAVTLHHRLGKLGWSVEKALTTPRKIYAK